MRVGAVEIGLMVRKGRHPCDLPQTRFVTFLIRLQHVRIRQFGARLAQKCCQQHTHRIAYRITDTRRVSDRETGSETVRRHANARLKQEVENLT